MKTLKLVKLYSLIVLYGLIFVAELIGSQLTQSLVLLVDSYHNLYTTLSLLLLVISYKLTSEETLKNTFGWVRVEILGSLFNMIFFGALCFSVLMNGIQSLAHAGHEDVLPSYPTALIIAGVVGLAVHVLLYVSVGDLVRREAGFLSITGSDVVVNCVVTSGELAADAKDSLSLGSNNVTRKRTNKRESVQQLKADEADVTGKLLAASAPKSNVPQTQSLRQIIRDFSSSLILIVMGLLVIYVDLKFVELADPILGMVAVVVLVVTFYPTMMASGLILLQTVPKHIDVSSLKKAMLAEFPSVLNIHDLHIWCLTGSEIIATCHVILPQHTRESYKELSEKMEQFLAQQGITLATVQPEFETEAKRSYSCLYKCSNSHKECVALKCCHDENDEACEAIRVLKS